MDAGARVQPIGRSPSGPGGACGPTTVAAHAVPSDRCAPPVSRAYAADRFGAHCLPSPRRGTGWRRRGNGRRRRRLLVITRRVPAARLAAVRATRQGYGGSLRGRARAVRRAPQHPGKTSSSSRPSSSPLPRSLLFAADPLRSRTARPARRSRVRARVTTRPRRRHVVYVRHARTARDS